MLKGNFLINESVSGNSLQMNIGLEIKPQLLLAQNIFASTKTLSVW